MSNQLQSMDRNDWEISEESSALESLKSTLSIPPPLNHGCQMAKFDPFLSLDCARVEGVGAQSKERTGSNFVIWQPCCIPVRRGRPLAARRARAHASLVRPLKE